MGQWPELLFNRDEFCLMAFVLQRHCSDKRDECRWFATFDLALTAVKHEWPVILATFQA
jgi:hypothetical protein